MGGYMPHVVLSGFISGVGVILILSQIQAALGTDIPAQGAVGAVLALPSAVLRADPETVIVAAVVMAILLFWPRVLDKWAPAPLTALAVATALGAFWLDGVAVIGAIPSGLPVPVLSLPSLDFLPSAVEPALLIALVASIYSLMMSLTADAITGSQHDPNRELVGQGVGNMAAGIFGAMPGAANPGTLINLSLGGRTVMAGVVRAVCLLALLLGLGRYAEPIPLAALSAILLKIGWELIDWRFVRSLRRMPRGYAVVMVLTFVLAVFAGPLTAIAFGLVAAGIVHAARLERMELDSVVSTPLLDRTFLGAEDGEAGADPFAARVGLLAFRGAFTVASSRKLVRMVGADIREHEVVIFDLSRVTHIDDSAANVIALLMDRAGKEKTEIIVLGMSGEARVILEAFDVLRRVPEDRIVEELDDARRLAGRLLAT
ncbi:MAG: SulP family inorganic anion transporter [Alphaproteobacteria bacterium]|nr:SulP family inorganic anion transporter [Alphaproteobacteria bacterium]